MKKVLSKCLKCLQHIHTVMPDKSDAFLFIGIGLLFYGIYQLHPPTAFSITGILFIGVGLINALPQKDKA